MKNKKGFTLIELLVVIAIIGIAAGLFVAVFIGIIYTEIASNGKEILKKKIIQKFKNW